MIGSAPEGNTGRVAVRSANQRTSTPADQASVAAPVTATAAAALAAVDGAGRGRAFEGVGTPPGSHTALGGNRLASGCQTGLVSDLKDRLRTDLTASMKARDSLRSSTLRMLLTSITNAEVAGKEQRRLTDEDVVGVLSTEAKRRREAATAFEDAGRADSAEKERAEADIIAEYLPQQLDDAEISALVSATIESLGAGAEGMRAMGRVMGALQPQVKGRADGGVVAAEVRRQLG